MGNLLGKTVTATISITNPAAYTGSYQFSAYTNSVQGCNSAQAIVRFYFSTKLVLGAEESYQPGLYADQLWWSKPVSIPLADLYGFGPSGTSLGPVTFAPANWQNLDGLYGTQLVGSYANDFSTAVSNVDQVGFSFGSPDCFAFGDGSSPAGALFNLTSFSIN
jgi:hypothetical protein